MLRKKPHTPEELVKNNFFISFITKSQVVKHVEFAAEFGEASALRPQSHEMTWIEYNNVVRFRTSSQFSIFYPQDIVLVGILLCLFIFVICIKIVLALTRKIGKAKNKIE